MTEREPSDAIFDPDHLIFIARELPSSDFESRRDMFRAAGEIYESAYRLYPEIETGKRANAVIESMSNYVQARELNEAARFGREALEDFGNNISPMQRYDIQERIRLVEIQLGR
jgi:hypothetical protein